ncbi:E3 ubiquitin-protein ligase RHA2A [Striga hermonthica]|uniref:E3 ubiquitin-protein ligase RHA2A n=1 Tax=Striga hermonthica TaxID=68872 RepID=A0A9N7RK52_STRHE|nr:E3 ubiquitin-protein ligase RHA2A [Striga hermonthica]
MGRCGLARISGICGRLAQNRAGSHRYRPESGEDRDCVVCLDRLREGDEVRTLACRHVFHWACLDSWLDQLNLICPLCRAPVESEERVENKRRRVDGDSLLEWFQAAP